MRFPFLLLAGISCDVIVVYVNNIPPFSSSHRYRLSVQTKNSQVVDLRGNILEDRKVHGALKDDRGLPLVRPGFHGDDRDAC